MSEFYGGVIGSSNTEATRRGFANKGIISYAKTWNTKTFVEYLQRRDKKDDTDRILIDVKTTGGDTITPVEINLNIDTQGLKNVILEIQGVKIPIDKLEGLKGVLEIAEIVNP